MPVISTDHTPSRSPWAHRLSVGVFVVVFVTPLAVTVVDMLGGSYAPQEEQRAEPPAFPRHISELRQFIRESGRYLVRRIGLRQRLTTLRARLMTEWLGVSASDDVILGKDGFLFDSDEGTLDDARSLGHLTEDELTRLVGELRSRRDRAAKLGARYVVVVAPDKQTIYPEAMPDRFRRRHAGARLDQVLPALGEARIDALDLRPAMLAGKRSARVYHRSDTHWNALGAYLGSQAIAEHLRNELPELPAPATGVPPIEETTSHGGDLARMLALQAHRSERRIGPAVSRPALYEDGRVWEPLRDLDVVTPEQAELTHPGGAPGTLSVLDDSFGVAVMPWLSAFFERTIYRASYGFPDQALATDRPRVIVQLLAERDLHELSAAYKLSHAPGVPVMFGDSLTAGHDFGDLFDNYVNAGRGGDTVVEAMQRLPRIAKRVPPRIYVMLGANDLLRRHPVEQIVADYGRLLDMALRLSPASRITVQSVLPMGRDLVELAPSIVELNRRLASLASSRGADFVDLHSRFIDDAGLLPAELSIDAVHLSVQGYARWTQTLAAHQPASNALSTSP